MPSLTAAHALPSQPERIAQRYRVRGELARGGMGVVYEVEELASGAVLALKRIRADVAARGETSIERQARHAAFVSAFEREYQVLASIDHPRIIRVHDYGL